MAKPSSRKRIESFEMLLDYEQRSLAHVVGRPEMIEAPGHWRGVGFRLGHRLLVSSFDEVMEILSLPPITPVPGAQAWMLGVANVRGTLLPVVDLKQFLEGERTLVHEGQRVLLVRQGGGNVAVLIDEMFGENEGRYGHFVDRAYRLGDTSWGVFSMSVLTRTPEFRQAAL